MLSLALFPVLARGSVLFFFPGGARGERGAGALPGQREAGPLLPGLVLRAAGFVLAGLLLPERVLRHVRGGRVGAVPALHRLLPVRALLPVPKPDMISYNAFLGPFVQCLWCRSWPCSTLSLRG